MRKRAVFKSKNVEDLFTLYCLKWYGLHLRIIWNNITLKSWNCWKYGHSILSQCFQAYNWTHLSTNQSELMHSTADTQCIDSHRTSMQIPINPLSALWHRLTNVLQKYKSALSPYAIISSTTYFSATRQYRSAHARGQTFSLSSRTHKVTLHCASLPHL